MTSHGYTADVGAGASPTGVSGDGTTHTYISVWLFAGQPIKVTSHTNISIKTRFAEMSIVNNYRINNEEHLLYSKREVLLIHSKH